MGNVESSNNKNLDRSRSHSPVDMINNIRRKTPINTKTNTLYSSNDPKRGQTVNNIGIIKTTQPINRNITKRKKISEIQYLALASKVSNDIINGFMKMHNYNEGNQSFLPNLINFFPLLLQDSLSEKELEENTLLKKNLVRINNSVPHKIKNPGQFTKQEISVNTQNLLSVYSDNKKDHNNENKININDEVENKNADFEDYYVSYDLREYFFSLNSTIDNKKDNSSKKIVALNNIGKIREGQSPTNITIKPNTNKLIQDKSKLPSTTTNKNQQKGYVPLNVKKKIGGAVSPKGNNVNNSIGSGKTGSEADNTSLKSKQTIKTDASSDKLKVNNSQQSLKVLPLNKQKVITAQNSAGSLHRNDRSKTPVRNERSKTPVKNNSIISNNNIKKNIPSLKIDLSAYDDSMPDNAVKVNLTERSTKPLRKNDNRSKSKSLDKNDLSPEKIVIKGNKVFRSPIISDSNNREIERNIDRELRKSNTSSSLSPTFEPRKPVMYVKPIPDKSDNMTKQDNPSTNTYSNMYIKKKMPNKVNDINTSRGSDKENNINLNTVKANKNINVQSKIENNFKICIDNDDNVAVIPHNDMYYSEQNTVSNIQKKDFKSTSIENVLNKIKAKKTPDLTYNEKETIMEENKQGFNHNNNNIANKQIMTKNIMYELQEDDIEAYLQGENLRRSDKLLFELNEDGKVEHLNTDTPIFDHNPTENDHNQSLFELNEEESQSESIKMRETALNTGSFGPSKQLIYKKKINKPIKKQYIYQNTNIKNIEEESPTQSTGRFIGDRFSFKPKIKTQSHFDENNQDEENLNEYLNELANQKRKENQFKNTQNKILNFDFKINESINDSQDNESNQDY